MKKIYFLLSIVVSIFVLASCTVTSNVTVTFDTVGGSSIEPVTLEKGSILEKPEDPVKTEFNFVDWYESSSYEGQAYDFSQSVESSFTLYAKWEGSSVVDPTPTPTPTPDPVQTFIVSFETDGGSTVSSQNVSSGAKASKPSDPTKDGYIFNGWFTTLNGNVEFDFDTTITSNITIYAKWTEEQVEVTKYSLTWNAMGGTATASTTEVEAGSTVASLPTASKDGYTFEGWYTDDTYSQEFTTSTIINSSMTIYAKWEEVVPTSTAVYSGYAEGLFVKWNDTNASNASVTYKKSSDSSWTNVDSELVRNVSPTLTRVDIVGLEAGEYDVKITSSSNATTTISNIAVAQDDRSGYAHFNASRAVGAYENSGALKSNATVVYVTDENKNSVTATYNGKTYTGLAKILSAATNKSYALDVRIIGTIKAPQWNVIDYGKSSPDKDGGILMNGEVITASNTSAATLIENGVNSYSDDYLLGIKDLDGLDSRLKYSNGVYDSYWNMMNVSGAENVTVEGIGTDAGLYQWGFTWKSSSYIEVKNLSFTGYTEDACSFEGPSGDNSSTLEGFGTGHNWVHGCTINIGDNNWDVSDEQDKHEGDGGIDLKYNAYTTLSYNRFYKTHKTGLVGGSDSAKTACVTFHHNYYESCQSRLPFARQANMHMYNNYYSGSTGTNMQLYAGAYAFIENCYFENVNKPMVLDARNLGTPAAKLLNNVFSNCKGTNDGTVVSSRTETVTNDNLYGPNFDTDTTLFYYDEVNQESDVYYMTDAEQAKIDCKAYSGVLKDNDVIEVPTPEDENTVKYTVSFETNGGSTLTSISVKEGRTFTPATPTKQGYKFDGWYLDSALTLSYTTSYRVTANAVLYAKWVEKTGEPLTLDVSGLAEIITSDTVAGDMTIHASSKTVNIVGGTTAEDGTSLTGGVSLNGGGSLTDRSISFSVADTGSYTITFYIKGGSSERTLNITDSEGNIINTCPATSSIVKQTIVVSGYTTYYLYSAGSGITLYDITVE